MFRVYDISYTWVVVGNDFGTAFIIVLIAIVEHKDFLRQSGDDIFHSLCGRAVR